MEKYLNYTKDWLIKHGAQHTAKEISQQPLLWKSTVALISQNRKKLDDFLAPLLASSDLEIILTGAGSSAFAGVSLAPWLRENTQKNVHAYPSTEIVANPLEYLSPSKKTLLISYARSGNSPESLATVKLADQLIPNCYHLFLTCNPQSTMTKYALANNNPSKICELVMPKGSHDLGFAMTSSITCMILATLLIFSKISHGQAEKSVNEIINICDKNISDWQYLTKELAQTSAERMIFIGSGCFTGIAQESALKVLELSAGKTASLFNSSLGLRHGPKFMINKQSIVICFLSNSPYTKLYDIDLLKELEKDNIAKKIIALSGSSDQQSCVLSINTELEDCWLIFPYLLFSQLLAFENSLVCKITPDNPCPSGEVNRVVAGVNIYSFNKDKSTINGNNTYVS